MPMIRRRGPRRTRRTYRRNYMRNSVSGTVNSTVFGWKAVAHETARTNVAWTYNQLLPDVQAGRPVIIDKVVVQAAITSGNDSCNIAGALVGEPWTAASNIITPNPPLPVGSVTKCKVATKARPAIFSLRPKLTGQRNWVYSDQTNQLLVLSMFTGTVDSTKVLFTITTFYRYDNDPAISVVNPA